MTLYMYCHDLSFMIIITVVCIGISSVLDDCLSINFQGRRRGSQLKENSFSPIRLCHAKVTFSISILRLMKQSFKLLNSNSLSRFTMMLNCNHPNDAYK